MRALNIAIVFLTASCAPSAPPDPLALGDHAVPVDGVTLASHVAGRGPLCVVIPGGPGLTWTYARMPELEKRLTLVYVEPIGSGASGRLPPGQLYSVQRYAEQLEMFRAAVGIDRPCLLGHSHGGLIAQRYAIDHPDHVGPLVLYDTLSRDGHDLDQASLAGAKRFEDKPWYADAMKAFEAPAPTTDAAATATWVTSLPLYFRDYDAHRAAYDAAAKVPVSAAPNVQVAKSAALFDLRPEYGQLAAPTLVIVGSDDIVIPKRFSQEIADGIRGATLVVLAQSGHMGHLEEPERFARV